MKVLNFGSLNIDYVYSVAHMTREGETQKSFELNTYVGGKGLNQSVALRRAGVEVYHAGMVGEEGDLLLDACTESGIYTTYIKKVNGKSGHTIIQVDAKGQNSIILYGGSNNAITEEFIEAVLKDFSEGDTVILQNEISMLKTIIDKAYQKKLRIILNPSPINEELFLCDLSKVSAFILNEIEGREICKEIETPKDILREMSRQFPAAEIILTLGEDGCWYKNGEQEFYQPVYPVRAIDTTAAGDTFTGFFISGLLEQKNIQEAMRVAAAAAALAVTKQGAVPSIPYKKDVMAFIDENGRR